MPEEEQGSTQNLENEAPEYMFRVGDGDEAKDIAFKDLTPELAQEWYKDHTHKRDWQRTQTQRDMELAKERKKYEGYGEIPENWREIHSEYGKWNGLFEAEIPLQTFTVAYVNPQHPLHEKVIAFVKEILGGNGMSGPTFQQPAPQQRGDDLSALKKEIAELKEQLGSVASQTEESRALTYLKTKFKDFDESAFQKFLETNTADDVLKDTSKLYEIIELARRGATSGEMAKKAASKAVQTMQAQRSAATEQGGKQPGVGLPENIEAGSDLRSAMRKYMENKGIDEFAPVDQQPS